MRKATSEITPIGNRDPCDPHRIPVEVIRKHKKNKMITLDRQVFNHCVSNQQTYNSVSHMLREHKTKECLDYILNSNSIDEFTTALKIHTSPEFLEHLPPQDTFFHWNFYTETNYEELRNATESAYHDKPDLDLSCIIYDTFDDNASEKFEKFRDLHQDELLTNVHLINAGQWTLLGDFKKNRENVEIYNKHTDILKRIFDKHDEDKALGTDLMEKRVKKLKAKNIKAAGADAPGLAKYKSENSLEKFGGKKVISDAEMNCLASAGGNLRRAEELKRIEECKVEIKALLNKAKTDEGQTTDERLRLESLQREILRIEEIHATPEDAIQIDVWKHDVESGTLKKDHFFSQAENLPLSDYAKKYNDELKFQ